MVSKTVTKNDRYTYRVTWSEEDEEHVGLCVEFPSLSWLANTPEAALKGIRVVVADAISDMKSCGETIPEPFAIRQYSGVLTLRIPPEIHRIITIKAAEAKISRNRYISSKLID